MKNIILKELRYRLPYIIISVVVFRLCWYINKSYNYLEMSYFLFPIIFCGMLFRSEDEIELIRTSNTRMSTLLVVRYLITFLYMVVLPVVVLIIDGGDLKWKYIYSLVTTLLFSTSFSLFYRVILKNPYATALFSVFTHTLFVFSFRVFLGSILKISNAKTFQRLSPYGSETITNKGIYGNNRMIVIGLALAVIAISYIILRRKEKFYRE